MIAHMLRRLYAVLTGPPRLDYTSIPLTLRRDVGLDTPSQPDGELTRPARPFSFRIHPVSELVEIRERLRVAIFAVSRHKVRRPRAA